ncbi:MULTISPECIES: hypothetical protein [Streptomyces]|uniref:Uncharacterized protein n=1 Tax=Streptomyces lienomycini TaxID=284035 RepID=A0ABV9WR62_9ACTN|nr:hypothetical protein [Streptomyces lienomycini]
MGDRTVTQCPLPRRRPWAPLVPPERRAPLLGHRELPRQTVERNAPPPADRAFALLPDRRGVG